MKVPRRSLGRSAVPWVHSHRTQRTQYSSFPRRAMLPSQWLLTSTAVLAMQSINLILFIIFFNNYKNNVFQIKKGHCLLRLFSLSLSSPQSQKANRKLRELGHLFGIEKDGWVEGKLSFFLVSYWITFHSTSWITARLALLVKRNQILGLWNGHSINSGF